MMTTRVRFLQQPVGGLGLVAQELSPLTIFRISAWR